MEGKDVGDFEIKRIIGEGTLGPVYLAEHKFIKKLFALKFLPTTLLEDATFRKAFIDDMSKIAALSHDNLAAVHNVSTFKGQLFIVSDYIPYKSPLAMNLGSYLSTCAERLKEAEVLKILKEVAFALDYIHSQHVMSEPIVHGGIKLGNILLSEKKDGTYQVKLSDTGLVGLLGSNFVLAHMGKDVIKFIRRWKKSSYSKA
jgi:serine/threonine protein kinase